MVPLILQLALARGLNPVPLLLGFCFAANNGAAATLIGSPQNMIIAQQLRLSFTGFMQAALLPSMLSLVLIWARAGAGLPRQAGSARRSRPPGAGAIPFDRLETAKAALVTLLVVAAFLFTGWPPELSRWRRRRCCSLTAPVASSDLLGACRRRPAAAARQPVRGQRGAGGDRACRSAGSRRSRAHGVRLAAPDRALPAPWRCCSDTVGNNPRRAHGDALCIGHEPRT